MRVKRLPTVTNGYTTSRRRGLGWPRRAPRHIKTAAPGYRLSAAPSLSHAMVLELCSAAREPNDETEVFDAFFVGHIGPPELLSDGVEDTIDHILAHRLQLRGPLPGFVRVGGRMGPPHLKALLVRLGPIR